MLDSSVRKIIDPPLDLVGRLVAKTGISANALTFIGFALGLLVMIALAVENYMVALGLIVANRFFDGLDGAVARRNGVTDLGGYFDIVGDFIFFGAVVMGFALANPQQNAMVAAFLLFSFVGTEASFLAYAVMAAKRGLSTKRFGVKSMFYLGGLVEATETFLLFVLLCLWPDWFVWLATGFAVLCWMTTAARVAVAAHTLRERK